MKTSHSISRRPIKRLVSYCLSAGMAAGMLVAGLLGLVGRGAAPLGAAAAPAATEITVGIPSDVVDLDPALTFDISSWQVVSQIFDTLTIQPADGSYPQPGLASGWTVSTNGLTWTFSLRPGVTFHDGTPLDAAAVAFNFQRWWDPENPYHEDIFEYFKFTFGGFKGDDGCILTAVNTLGSDQVQLVLSEPRYSLPTFLTMPPFSIASPAAIQAGALSIQPVGSGAFTFVERQIGDSLVLQANPDYWSTPSSLDTLIFVIIPDPSQVVLELKSGAIDVASNLSDDNVALVANDPAFLVQWRAPVSLGYLGINRSHTYLDDPRVRQAIAHAIDVPTLVENDYAFGAGPADQFLPDGIWGGDPELDGYSYDPALSVALLEQAGYTDGITTTLAYRNIPRPYLPDPALAANDISAALEAVGIHAQLVEYESAEFIDKWTNGELDLFMLGWFADYLHPDDFFSPLLCNPATLGLGPMDMTLCSMVEAALAEPEYAGQLAAYQSASRYVYDSVPLLPLTHATSALVSYYEIAGLVATPLGLESYRGVNFPGVEQELVVPEEEASLVLINTDDTSTTIDVPTGAVTETVLLRLAATEVETTPPEYASAGQSFELEASQDGFVLDDFAFLEPLTFTLEYTDADVAWVKEETLLLFYWDGSQWIDAATTCDPVSAYLRDLEANRLSLQVCHLTPFGLFAEAENLQFLPLLTKK